MHEDVGCDCKVARTRSEYEVEMDDDALVAAWQGETSVRELTRTFNEAVIERRLEATDGSGVAWSRVPVYEALGTDALSDAEVVEVRRELERNDVDPDALEAALLSHQTMYRHLTSCLDATASPDPTPEERREKARDTVYALQRRTTLVTESAIDTLQGADAIEVGDPDVLVDVQIVCRDCGRSMDFETALAEGCDCP